MCVLSINTESTPRSNEMTGIGHGGSIDALGAPVYASRKIAIRRDGVPCWRFRNPQSRRHDRLPAARHRSAGGVVAGRDRRAGAEVFPARRRRAAPEEGRRGRHARVAVAFGAGRRRARRAAGRPALRRRDQRAQTSSIAWPAPGPTGAGRAATSTARPTPAPSTTSIASCWRRRWPRRTRRSGSTPACTGPTASTGRARATGTSIIATATPIRPTLPTSGRSRTPASSRASSDELVSEGGIMDLWVREARLFKYGSGTGSNFSRIRGSGERLSGGGKSSGLMSFLKIGDRAAGAIKSGGTTRRAAKMVVVDVDHPDIEEFISWKMLEEQKVAALVAGSRLANRHLNAIMEACADGLRSQGEPAAAARDRRRAPGRAAGELHPARHPVRAPGLQPHRVPDLRHRLGVRGLRLGGRARTPTTSVRVTDDFLRAVEADREWALTARTTGVPLKTVSARRPVGSHRRGRLALGRSRRAVRHDDQRLAHLPRVRTHQRVQPVLGVHVPRRHGVQSRLAEPDAVPPGRRLGRCRGARACQPPVDNRARDLGDDGAVPVAHGSPSCPIATAPSAWATPTSARC